MTFQNASTVNVYFMRGQDKLFYGTTCLKSQALITKPL